MQIVLLFFAKKKGISCHRKSFFIITCCLPTPIRVVLQEKELCGVNSLNGANISARATIRAYIRVYFVDVAFAYCVNRAFVDATATSSTIFCDYVSHCFKI